MLTLFMVIVLLISITDAFIHFVVVVVAVVVVVVVVVVVFPRSLTILTQAN